MNSRKVAVVGYYGPYCYGTGNIFRLFTVLSNNALGRGGFGDGFEDVGVAGFCINPCSTIVSDKGSVYMTKYESRSGLVPLRYPVLNTFNETRRRSGRGTPGLSLAPSCNLNGRGVDNRGRGRCNQLVLRVRLTLGFYLSRWPINTSLDLVISQCARPNSRRFLYSLDFGRERYLEDCRLFTYSKSLNGVVKRPLRWVGCPSA